MGCTALQSKIYISFSLTLSCFAEHGKSSLLMAGARVEKPVQPDQLLLAVQMQQPAAVPLDPRSCPGLGLKLSIFRHWFSRPANQICPVYWEAPMSTAKLQRTLTFRMVSHVLPIEQGRHLRLPYHRRVYRLFIHFLQSLTERHPIKICVKPACVGHCKD